MQILGLDLGTNSIGWAIRDTAEQDNQIIDKGVLIFEKGVGEGKSGEFPMVQKRTESRGKRRNYQAEKYRKWALLKTLISVSLCPLTMDELNEWKHYKKGSGRRYPQSKKFIQWLRFDFDGDGKPDFERFGLSKHESLYVFRMLAASNESAAIKILKDEPQILGRVLYQLVQRRGFRGRDEEESKTIMKGGGDSGAKGVQEVEPYIEKYGTLGAALYHLQKEKGERIRKRYNLRSHYEHELQQIAKVHGINDELYKHFWKAIIWQRPLRSQKGLVGICTFEKNKSRAPISHPFYEEYRTWVFINNLKIVLPASINHEVYLQEKIYPLFYNAARDFKLKKILDRLKKDGGHIEAKFKEDTKVISCTLLNLFKNLLGDDWKKQYSWYEAMNNQPKTADYSFEDIWHVLATFDSHEKLKEFALEKLKLDKEDAELFSKLKLQKGYATLSLTAIKKLLPYLKKGFKSSHVVYLGNMHKVIGAKEINADIANHLAETFDNLEKELKQQRTVDEIVNSLIADHQNAVQRWGMEPGYELDADDKKDIDQKIIAIIGHKTWEEKKSEEEKTAIQTAVATAYQYYLRQHINTPLSKIFPKKERLHDKIFKHLQDTYGLTDDAIKHLWHPSEQEGYPAAPIKNGIKVLGDPQPISQGFKNPMALKTLHKLKAFMNYLLAEGNIDDDTRIVVEIARELNDANKRKAIERWQRKRELENAEFSKRIEEIVKECNLTIDPYDKEIVDKYRLWVEQNETCLYTGKRINICDLFNGAIYDFEHTVPASMSFDNELKNLSLSDGIYNKQIKGKRLPTELPNYYEDVTVNGKTYTAIEPRLKFLFDKVESLEDQQDEWKKKTSDDKGVKDAIIQRRHLIRMELDYWRKKLDTFTIKEYKAGWRNSQLRDTQVITKYALPYLKTVFNKVDVQKGAVTAAFREIYKIQPRMEKKSRDKHSHHAMDAAVLTLIPSAQIRDKILLRYNEEKDNNPHNTYHETPRDWKNFAAHHILSLEDEMLINFQPQHRTLTATYKNVRKRGRQQFVKQKDENGKWHFKLDGDGKQIPLVAKGDTIRGQLHKESFFGAIKLNGEQMLVERYPISAFTKIEDCKNIVDKAVSKIVEDVLKERMAQGLSFDKAKLEPIPFPSGKAVIKKIRCKVAAGRGFLTPGKALQIRKQDSPSKHEYKNFVYAQNEENTLCLFYESMVDGKTERAFKIVGLFELAQSGLKSTDDLYNEPYYNSIETGRAKIKTTIPLRYIIEVGTKVIFYQEHKKELVELPEKDLLKRVFKVYKFNEPAPGTIYCYLQNHLEARPNDQLGNGEKNLNLTKFQPRLFLGASKFNCIIEGKDFIVKPDGQIHYQF
jgi:CRISPR-associated endonuclease Csn1